MKIELVKAWNGAAAGEVIDPDPPVAELLIARGLAVRVDQAVSPVERERPARAPKGAGKPRPSELKKRK